MVHCPPWPPGAGCSPAPAGSPWHSQRQEAEGSHGEITAMFDTISVFATARFINLKHSDYKKNYFSKRSIKYSKISLNRVFTGLTLNDPFREVVNLGS